MRAVLVPGVLALLPEYAGLTDPVADLRAACLSAVAWLGEGGPVEVVGSPQGERVAGALLVGAGVSRLGRQGALAPRPAGGGQGALAPRPPMLVVGNGSARRTEKAPGHLDPRSHAFDEALGRALRVGDAEALSGIDQVLARELWADTEHLPGLVGLGPAAAVDYDDDPFGVQYWVMRWSTA
jgi:hypothetical protein